MMDAKHCIATITVLNVDHHTSTIQEHQLIRHDIEDNSYIISDIDQQLLILVTFKSDVRVNSVKLFAKKNLNVEDMKIETSPPKQIHIYKCNDIYITLEDIQFIIPHQSIVCESNQLGKGQSIDLKSNDKFNSVKYLALYIALNQEGTQHTHINGISFDITQKEQPQTIDMSYHVAEMTDQEIRNLTRLKRFNDDNYEQIENAPGGMLGFLDMLLGPMDEEELLNIENDAKMLHYDEVIVDQLAELGLATRAQLMMASSLIDNYWDPNAVYEKVLEIIANDDNQTDFKQETVVNEQHIVMDCQLQNCKYLNEINDIMIQYQKFIAMKQSDHSDDHDNKVDVKNDLDNKEILNCFHHLLRFHEHEFEETYKIIIDQCNNGNQCDLNNCVMIRRNHRDRLSLRDHDQQLNQMYLGLNMPVDINICTQQILDKIHCHYFHSFDIGYRLSQIDRDQIEKVALRRIHELATDTKEEECFHDDVAILEIGNIMRKRKTLIRNIKGLERINNEAKTNTKFTAQAYDQMDLAYGFGIRFFYWNYYKNTFEVIDPFMNHAMADELLGTRISNHKYTLAELYIVCKYVDLKDEMINNAICNVSPIQWNNVVQKAAYHMKTQFVKNITIYPRLIQWDIIKYYDLSHNSQFTRAHLIALMLHCNFDILQAKFNETCRRIPNTESNECIKKRHSNYATFGRLLRESVECFVGPNDYEINCTQSLYHGITIDSQFSAIKARINAPVSSTIDYAVAVNFCGNKGMIIEFTTELSGASFRCNWLSDYPNENEVFFIGGMYNLLFESISRPNGVNYGVYVRALGALCGDRHRATYETMTETERQISFRILSHQLRKHYPNNEECEEYKSLPQYMNDLIALHFSNVDVLKFMPIDNQDGKLTGIEFVEKVYRHLLFQDYGWIKLDILTTIFPKLKYIELNDHWNKDDGFVLNVNIYNDMLKFLQYHKNTTLRRITIAFGTDQQDQYKTVSKVEQMVESFLMQFIKLEWAVFVADRFGYKVIMQSYLEESLLKSLNKELQPKLLFQ